MADTPTLTPEEIKAMAAAKAAAVEKAAKSSAGEVSKGLVTEGAAADPVAKGVSAMDEYASPAERKAAFAANADRRFTTPNQPEMRITPYGERGLVPYQPPAAGGGAPPPPSGPATGASSPGGAGGAPKSPWYKPSAGAAGLMGAYVADALIPRANDGTDAGYNVNTTRDTAMSALNTGALVPMLLKTKNPWAIGAAAALGGGTALYNRLHNYNTQHPENDSQHEYKTPNAQTNFWEQGPAVVQDAGHLASKALRGIGDGVGYDVEHYTPYPYLRDGAQKAVDYFTPPSATPKFEGGQQILREATASPVGQYSEEASEALHPKLGANEKLESDGTITKSVYDDRGNYLGYGNRSVEKSATPSGAVSPQDGAQEILKQQLTPEAQAIYDRRKTIMDQSLSSKPAVMKVSPSGQLVQTNYDEDGNIVRSQNPGVRHRVDELLRERSLQAQAQMPEFEAGHVQRHENYLNGISNSPDAAVRESEANRWAQYNAAQQMERASAPRMTGDPLRDAPISANIANAAKGQAIANGEDPTKPNVIAKYLPKENGVGALESNASTNDLAMQALRGTSMPSMINHAITQNFGGSRTDEAENRRAIDQITKQATIDQKDDAASTAAERLELAKQTAQNTRDAKESARDAKESAMGAQRIKGLEGRLDRVDKEILTNQTNLGDIGKKKGAALNLKTLDNKRAKIQADLDKASGLEPEGGQEVAPTSDSGDTAPQTNSELNKESMEKDQVVVGKDGKSYRWTGTGFVPA